jgi:hypothetical protein
MADGPSAADSTAAQPDSTAAPGGAMVPPPEPPAGPGDPNRHFDGQQWLVWNGTAWAPEAPPVPPSSGGRRTLVVVVAVVVVALVAGGVFVASRIANANKPIVIPSSLGGLPKATDADLIAAADEFRKNGSTEIKNATSDAAAYGSAGNAAFLVVGRVGSSSDDFFSGAKSAGVDISDVATVGNSHCVTAQTQGVSVCMRSSGQLTVAVVLGPSDTVKASAMVDEAWDQQ